MVRIVLMYYLNMQTFFNKPEEDLKLMLIEAAEPLPEETLNSQGYCPKQISSQLLFFKELRGNYHV